jgi:hypothetical protein
MDSKEGTEIQKANGEEWPYESGLTGKTYKKKKR